MSLKQYEAFAKVVELGSLTKAAEALGYTQSGVSHMLNALEEELGIPLLRRSRAGVRLTDGGARILPAVRSLLGAREQIRQIAADLRGLDAGTVRIGTFTSVAVHWLPGMIKEFQQDYPHVEFKLLNGDYHDVEQWLAEGSVDLGFVTLPSRVGCECIPLTEDRLLAVLPADHPLAGEERFPLSRVDREDFISLLESSDQDARRTLEAAGVKPNIKFTTKDDYAIIAMVENGLGMSILPELLLEGRAGRCRVMELSPPAKRVIALAVPAESRSGPAIRRFADHVRRWVDRQTQRK